MTASSMVMNCDDLRNQIFSYAFQKIPNECEDCYCENMEEKPKLYLYKSSSFTIRTDFKDIDEFESYLQSPNKPLVKTINSWYCNECFRKVVGGDSKIYNILGNKIYDEFKRQNPLMEDKKLLKQTEKYLKMVLYDDHEKTYRIKKTNELMVLFRNMVLDATIQGFKEQKENSKKTLNEKIEQKRETLIIVRQQICNRETTMFMKEILMRKINKLFNDKKIDAMLFGSCISVIHGLSYNFNYSLKFVIPEIERKYRANILGKEIPNVLINLLCED